MHNIAKIKLKKFKNEQGQLTPIENCRDIPFEIKRVYYITNVKSDIRRGFHSHKALHQVLICLSGSVKILVKNPYQEQIIDLSDSAEGLYIGPMIWREMYDFSPGSALLVLASDYYNEDDYIRDYSEYEILASKFFGGVS